jgi:MEMO1 family protein
MYGGLLAPYLDDPANLFIISTDFCHWGRRFSYTYYDETKGSIWQSIKWLDELGMSTIEEGEPAAFATYLRTYSNTVCGRVPVAILLNTMKEARQKGLECGFRYYDQSSKVEKQSDSSVSYASALVVGDRL